VTLQVVDVSSLGEPHPAAKALYFTVNDLEAAHGRAKSLHCLSREDVHDEPGGGTVVRPWGERSFYALDPWKNPLCFVEAGNGLRGIELSPLINRCCIRRRTQFKERPVRNK
jgi:hypothetical protein